MFPGAFPGADGRAGGPVTFGGDGDLQARIRDTFGWTGALARADDRFTPREGQTRMALAVLAAIEDRSVLVAEAGTGVGKTFAYLVPTLLSGARALVSTATKSLQDQLFLRDLPRLRDALGVPATLALLKGRSSYLCLHRLEQARHTAALPDRFAVRTLARIEEWAHATSSGDLAEIDGLDDRSPVIPLVTSTRDNCIGTDCPQHRACHVMKARRDAMAADVVVVNHHLFFADMLLRDSGVAELLPTVDVAVFDEAHQLPEAGVQFLGTVLGSGQLLDLARDLQALGLAHARGAQPWGEVSGAIEQAARDLRLACSGPLAHVRASIKLRWQERADRDDFRDALVRCAEAAAAGARAATSVAGASPDLDKLAERARTASRVAARFAEPAEHGQVRWIDLGANQARLVESPLDIRDAMQAQLEAARKGWVFTSATLGDDERMTWFTESAGLDDATVLRVESPFDYAAHARLYVPRAFPKPGDPAHPHAVASLAARLASALGGRTFVLTTTLRALPQIGERLQELLEAEDIDVLLQGRAPRRALMERFRARPRSVLVGSQSFWEGIDVPGDALQCVLIDKLPFPPPNDPIVEARVRRLEGEGRNPFADCFVADAAVSLKQGAGRLIRSETDRGLLVVCDPRLATMSYGRRLRQALPPMTPLDDEAAAIAWLAELAAAH